MNRVGDELLDYLRDTDSRKDATSKPRYFYGDRGDYDMNSPYAHYSDIPEEQFWNPPTKKHDK